MIIKSLIAATAVAASLTVLAPIEQAQAKTNFDVNIGIGLGGFYPGYEGGYGGGYYEADYYDYSGISCKKGGKIVKWAGFHNVHPIDCSAPVYGYKAKKNGHTFKVKVNTHGNIISVKKVW